MAKRKVDYPKLCKQIKRWRTRAKRAITMLDKLEKQKERMEKEWAKDALVTVQAMPTTQCKVVSDAPDKTALWSALG